MGDLHIHNRIEKRRRGVVVTYSVYSARAPGSIPGVGFFFSLSFFSRKPKRQNLNSQQHIYFTLYLKPIYPDQRNFFGNDQP